LATNSVPLASLADAAEPAPSPAAEQALTARPSKAKQVFLTIHSFCAEMVRPNCLQRLRHTARWPMLLDE